MKRILILITAALATIALSASPAMAQNSALDQIVSDGYFFDGVDATNIAAAANASDLAQRGVATVVANLGGADFAQTQAVNTLTDLVTVTNEYHTVIVVSDDGTNSGNNGIGIDSTVLTTAEQDVIFDAMVPRLIADDLAAAITAAENALPADLALRTPDIALESDATTSGLEPGALGEGGSSLDDSLSSGLEPGALDNEASTTGSAGDVADAAETTTESTGGGFSIGRIIFWGIILFIGYKIVKWFFGRKRKAAAQAQATPVGHGEGPFSQTQSQSTGGLGTSRRGGGILGSLAGAALPSILGNVLNNRSSSSTSSTGLSSSTGRTTRRTSGGSIFSGRRTGSSRSSRGRSRSFKRRGRSRKF